MRNTMKRFFLNLFLVVGTFVYGQNAQKADQLFKSGDYEPAMGQYELLLKKQPNNQLYLYRYARCADELGQKKVAKEYFVKAGNKYALRDYYLGELYFADYQFDEAIEAYRNYLKAGSPDEARQAKIEEKISFAQKAARYIKRVEDVRIIDSINLPKKDFLRAYNLSAESGSLSKSGELVFYTNQRQDRRIMALNIDSTIQLTRSDKLLNQWSDDEILPENINMSSRQNYPFYLSDGVTLYFASDSPDGLGGYDIYMTQYDPDSRSYRNPENIGFPFNSAANDYMFAIDEANNRGYFASDRYTGEGMVTIYTFIPNSETKTVKGNAEEIANAARIRDWHQNVPTDSIKRDEQPRHTEVIVKKEDKQSAEAIQFVVNDTIVITSLDDFRSADAREKYVQVIELEDHIRTSENRLNDLRKQYAKSALSDRGNITQEIVALEKEIPQKRAELTSLIGEVRQLEVRAR